MRLKIVLHIKLQFVSSDLMVVNKTHFKRHSTDGHTKFLSATLWSFSPTARFEVEMKRVCQTFFYYYLTIYLTF